MPRSLGQYRILRALGSGGQARTYLAHDPLVDRRVCIKLFHLKGALSDRRRARQEARRLATLESPRIASIYDVVASGAWLALVTRYLPGRDLDCVLERHSQLPAAQALAITADIAAALADLRRARMVHGDLKASNVILDSSGRAFLTDFGTAVLDGEGFIGSSDDALTPELLRGEPATLASDFFALGLLLYRMIFGRGAFDAQPGPRSGGFSLDGTNLADAVDPAALVRGLRKCPDVPDVPVDTQEAFKSLVSALLASRPGRRPQSTFELREQIRELRNRLPTPESPGKLIASLPLATKRADAQQIPSGLWSLPLFDRVGYRVSQYWSSGTFGARALFFLAVLAVPSLVLTNTLKPGECVAVNKPTGIDAEGRYLTHYSFDDLGAHLTSVVKATHPQTTVLGLGPTNESQYTVNAAGLRNRCVPTHYYELALECSDRTCRIELLSRTWSQSYTSALSVVRDVTFSELDAKLRQLVTTLENLQKQR
ncbi:MAG: protein kinase [Pseudomonadota bacterium]